MTALLTYCTCVDPRRINPATGHYPGCPDEIIPPECLLPPHEPVTRVENTLEGRGPRTEKHPDGKPIFGKIVHTDLVPGKAWTAARAAAPVAPVDQHAAADPSAPSDEPAILVVLDTETTGLRRTGTVVGVCEIGLSVIDLGPLPGPGGPRVIARHSKLLSPGMPIPREASAVHGILDADVQNCPHLADIFPALLAWVTRFAGESPSIIAHNAAYDREVIADVLRAGGLDLPPWTWRCSMQLARKVAPGLPSYSLHDSPGKAGLASSLQLVKGEGHRAMGDVVTTVSLLGALRARAGAWSSWRGDAVAWGAPKAAEAAEAPAKPVSVAEEPVEKPQAIPAPAPAKPQRKPARAVPSGPNLFDRLQERGPNMDAPERKTAS